MTSARRRIMGSFAVPLLFVGLLLSPTSAYGTPPTGTATISGVVRAPDGVSVPDGPVTARIITGGVTVNRSQVVNAATGAFSFGSLPSNTYYYLWVEYQGSSNIVTGSAWDGTPTGSSNQGPSFALGDGEARSFDVRLIAGGSIEGQVTGSDAALSSASIEALRNIARYNGVFDSADGSYRVDRLPPGSYTVTMSSTAEWDFVRWSVGGTGGPTAITIAEGQQVTGVDAVLPRKTTISGHAYVESGGVSTPRALFITAFDANGAAAASDFAAADGAYVLRGLAPGQYRICATSSVYVSSACYGDEEVEGGTEVEVALHQVLTGIDVTAHPAGTVNGVIKYQESSGSTPQSLPGGRVRFWRWDTDLENYIFVMEIWGAVPTGGFTAEGLREGDYVLQFVDPDGGYNSQWWKDARYFYDAIEITVVGGTDLDLGDVVLKPRTIDVSRLQGNDRFDVGVSISEALFESVPSGGVPVVYIANGYNFPDALAAGPAAALRGGAVLLVEPTAIPAAVKAELERLRPQKIVVAGGPASVSPAVFEQLKRYVPLPGDVSRANGIDRYEASRSVVEGAFGTGADMAIITTGANFPDALSAGPAAASQGGPVILVDGSASSIDSATEQLILDLGIDHVYIAGGTASVSPGIEASLKTLLGSDKVVRFAGDDRFEVGVLLAQEFFSSSEYTFVATGFKFPDALTGGPLAAAYGGPLYLAQPDCLPSAVGFDILDLDAQALVLLGGPGSLSPAVEQLQFCSS